MKHNGSVLAFKNEKGSSLIWVIILMLVFGILASSMLYVSSQDLRETVHFRENSKAYYLAESGIDIAYSALMKLENPEDVPLIYSYKNDTSKVYHKEIDVGDDTIILDIESVLVDGKWWVKVTSEGIVAESNTSEKVSLRIDVGLDNFERLIRESE